MRTFALLCLALLTTAPTMAAPRTWSMSGAELARAIQGQQPDGQPLPPAAAETERNRAQGYVMGVADSQASRPGCNPTHVLPHEQLARVHEHLRTLTPAQRHGPASPLVAAALAC